MFEACGVVHTFALQTQTQTTLIKIENYLRKFKFKVYAPTIF